MERPAQSGLPLPLPRPTPTISANPNDDRYTVSPPPVSSQTRLFTVPRKDRNEHRTRRPDAARRLEGVRRPGRRHVPGRRRPVRGCMPAKASRSTSPSSAAAAAAPAPPPTPCPPSRARSSWSPWPTRSRTSCESSFNQLNGSKRLADKVDVTEDTQVSSASTPTRRRWIRCGRATSSSSPRRRRSAGCSSPTPSRRASTSSWRSRSPSMGRRRKKMFELGEQSVEEEPEGRRRPHVPALRGPRRDVQAHQGRRRSATSRCCGPTAWPGPTGNMPVRPKKPEGMNELEYQIRQLPRLPVGQRRRLQRLPHPQHRRVLLDEGRLAGAGQVVRRPALSARATSIRTSTPTRPSTPSPTARSCTSKAGRSRAATASSPATATAPRGRE